MDFSNFEARFVKENRKLKMILGVVLIVFSIGSASILMQRRYYLYQGGSIFEERLLAEDVCRISFLSLANDEPNPFVVSAEIIKLVKSDPFSLNVEKILWVKSTKINHCKIALKADGKLLAFDVTLNGSDENPFYYQLIQLDEVTLNKEDT